MYNLRNDSPLKGVYCMHSKSKWASRGLGIVGGSCGSATVTEELIYFCGQKYHRLDPPPPRPHDIQLIPINGQI